MQSLPRMGCERTVNYFLIKQACGFSEHYGWVMRSNTLCKNNKCVLQEQPKQTGKGLLDRGNLFPSYVHLMTCCESALVSRTHVYFKHIMSFSSVANLYLHFQVM